METPPDQENALEEALRLAATDPAARPAFYETLLASTVYVLGSVEGAEGAVGEGAHTSGGGERLALVNWGREDGSSVLPFFSSLEALQRALTEPGPYVALPARSLFEITRGATLVMNPRSAYGKEFVPPEIEDLLAGGTAHGPRQRVLEEETRVLLGQPREYPTAMVEALRRLLPAYPAVRAAHFALMQDPARDEHPHLVVGLDLGDADEATAEAAVRAAGSVAADTSPGGGLVDLVRVVEGEGGLSAYFLQAGQPFYERT